MNKWDNRFLAMARLVASWSKDPSTKCGCVIANDKWMISTGFNGYPSGVSDNIDDPRELKYAKTMHAELNAILHAKQCVNGYTMYVTPLQPCARCAAAIAQAGIKRIVVGVEPGLDESRWYESYRIAELIFNEKNIKLERIEYDQHSA